MLNNPEKILRWCPGGWVGLQVVSIDRSPFNKKMSGLSAGSVHPTGLEISMKQANCDWSSVIV